MYLLIVGDSLNTRAAPERKTWVTTRRDSTVHRGWKSKFNFCNFFKKSRRVRRNVGKAFYVLKESKNTQVNYYIYKVAQ